MSESTHCRVCRICGGPHYAKDLCSKHWQTLRKYGDPLGGRQPAPAGMKRCPVCDELKSVDQFHGKKRPGNYCKPCASAKFSVWREENPGRLAEIKRDGHRRLKARVLEAYGAFCACCGEDNATFLTMDHVENNGAEHRREVGGGSDGMYRWLVRNGFPDGFQVLCWNCNAAKEYLGECPHQRGVAACV